MVSQNLHAIVRSGTMLMVELSYTWVSYLAPFASGTHAVSHLLGLGVPFSPSWIWARASYSSWTLCWPFPLGFPCICQVVITLSWVLLALLSLMLASLTLIISHIARACLMSSQAEPFYITLATWYPIFLPGGDFPPSIVILHMLSLHWE